MDEEICHYCYKPAIKYVQTLVRWSDRGAEKTAHFECSRAAEDKCPQCKSSVGVKIPNGLPIYCEDCGWPDEDFGEEQ